MNRDILKRLGLDHLDVTSPDFLATLNRMQREARESLQQRGGDPRAAAASANDDSRPEPLE